MFPSPFLARRARCSFAARSNSYPLYPFRMILQITHSSIRIPKRVMLNPIILISLSLLSDPPLPPFLFSSFDHLIG
jgi:hypothetical protein